MIIYRYILKNHALPFLFANFTLISIFLLQFMMKFADRLVGKGLDSWVIVQLVAFNLAWMVVLVVPMAVLVATLMAFGSMAQNNEVAVMKSSGISLYRMVLPPFLSSIIIAWLLVLFNNHVYPDANHAARIMMQDISQKKPTLSLVPGVFSEEIPNYSILARDIDQKSNTMENLTIYDYSAPMEVNIVTASTGKLYFSRDQENLIMDLTRGEIHTSEIANTDPYRKVIFDEHRIVLPAEQFTFKQSTPGGPRSDRELSAQDMMTIVDSLKNLRRSFLGRLEGSVNKDFLITDSVYYDDTPRRSISSDKHLYLRVENQVDAYQNVILQQVNRIGGMNKEINNYMVEVHKKYSLPVACIVFILIGAPLGTMTRKGGFGVAAGISVLFFLVYWAFLIGGEKLADRGLLSAFWGMWSANFLLGALGLLLLTKAAKERVTISFRPLFKRLPRFLRSSAEEENEENNENS